MFAPHPLGILIPLGPPVGVGVTYFAEETVFDLDLLACAGVALTPPGVFRILLDDSPSTLLGRIGGWFE